MLSIQGIHLPKEIVLEIASNLPTEAIFQLRRSCRDLAQKIDRDWLRTIILVRAGLQNFSNERVVRSIYDDDLVLARRLNFRVITDLNLSYNAKISGAFLRVIARYCTSLTTVALTECNQVTDEELRLFMRSCSNTVRTIFPPDSSITGNLGCHQFSLVHDFDRGMKGQRINERSYLMRRQ